eukprot:gene9014-12157_t
MIDPTSNVLTKSESQCNSILFKEVCSLLDKIETTKGTDKKLSLIFTRDLKEFLNGQSIFPLMRLLLPLIDTERGKYGIKQASIAKLYVNALQLDKTSYDAQRLLDPSKSNSFVVSTSNTSNNNKSLITGDFATILEDVLQTRAQAFYSDKSIGDINDILDSLANAENEKEKLGIVSNKILKEFNAKEQKWIARIIFQDLKIGLKFEQLLGKFYPTALQRYNECSNLRLVCEEEGIVSELQGLQLFTKFSPMLAKGFSKSAENQVTSVEKAIGAENPFIMDIKLDGERMNCHISQKKVILYTRRGNDYTNEYLPLSEIITDQITIPDCILDGEVCAWDNQSQSIMPFGNNSSVGRTERELMEAYDGRIQGWDKDLSCWMKFIAFDVVYLNGPNSFEIINLSMNECGLYNKIVPAGEITNLPLAVRRKILSKIIKPLTNRVEIVEHRIVTSNLPSVRLEEIESYFNAVTLRGEEGLVVKNLNSPYELGEKSRGLGYWVKMKPEYGNQTDDLDLLILGAYFGEGKGVRGGGLSTFLCGVRDDSDHTRYKTLCKVGTGYSFAELLDLRKKLEDICVEWKRTPDHLVPWRIAKRDDRPDVYIPPEKSFVIQLKCAEVVESDCFSAGFTCRFPRVERLRYDKSYSEIMTLTDIINVRNKARATTHEVKEKSVKPKKTPDNNNVKRSFNHITDDQFSISTKRVAREGAIFERPVDSNVAYCVVGDEFKYIQENNTIIETYTREKIIEMIKKQGGEVIATQTQPDHIVVAGSKTTYQLKSLIESGKFDVIDFRYIVDCVKSNSLLPLKKVHRLGCSEKTFQQLEGQFDLFGDSYTEEITSKELSVMFGAMEANITMIQKKAIISSKPNKGGKNSKSEQIKTNESSKVLSDWESIKNLTWQQIGNKLTFEERDPLLSQRYNCLWSENVILYFDIYYDIGPLQSDEVIQSKIDRDRLCYASSLLMSTRCLASLYGAQISNFLHVGVTHIIMSQNNLSRAIFIKERIRALRLEQGHFYEKKIVSSDWIEACILRNNYIDVASNEFSILL